MNLFSLASSVTGVVQPNVAITVQVMTGATTSADFSRTPTYTSRTTTGQQQALTQADLRHVDGMNVQGEMASFYLTGDFNGVIRGVGQGGTNLLVNSQTWKVVSVPEQWPNWTRVIACLQA